MTAPLFRAPLFRLDPLPDGDRLRLEGDEGRHAARVRRLRPGEDVVLTDGRGRLVRGVVEAVERESLEVAVAHREFVSAPTPRLVVVQALVKGERSELAVELLTEIGVDEIVPWEAERCVARWSGEKSARRWSAAAEAAAKQSRRVHWPVVGEPADRAAVVERISRASAAVVLSEDATTPLTSLTSVTDAEEVVLVVGPEGGIAPDELRAFQDAGATSRLLGPTVLRASTAGAAAAAVLLEATGRW
jgi:16S rRNA (uracil1498-N3)-methyltransferase